MSDPNYLPDIKHTYFTIDDNFDKIYRACTSDAQRKDVTACRDSARDAFWAAVAANLKDNSKFVKDIHKNLKKTNKELKQSLQSLQDIVAFIQIMTQAVRLAASLAQLAAI